MTTIIGTLFLILGIIGIGRTTSEAIIQFFLIAIAVYLLGVLRTLKEIKQKLQDKK